MPLLKMTNNKIKRSYASFGRHGELFTGVLLSVRTKSCGNYLEVIEVKRLIIQMVLGKMETKSQHPAAQFLPP